MAGRKKPQLKKFSVAIKHTLVESATVEVEASSMAEARTAAAAIYKESGPNLDWEILEDEIEMSEG